MIVPFTFHSIYIGINIGFNNFYFIILREKIVIIKIDLFLKLIVPSCITMFCKLYFVCGYGAKDKYRQGE